MSVANLFNVPRDQQSLSYWTFANADSHTQIINAIQSQMNKTLTPFVLDPLPETDIQNFLLRHQIMHNDYEPLLGIAGNDFTGLNFDDPASIQFIWQLHANSHILAHTKLRISTT